MAHDRPLGWAIRSGHARQRGSLTSQSLTLYVKWDLFIIPLPAQCR